MEGGREGEIFTPAQQSEGEGSRWGWERERDRGRGEREGGREWDSEIQRFLYVRTFKCVYIYISI